MMVKKKLPADKAFRWLQKKSMDTRKSMREIANAIIISQDLLVPHLTSSLKQLKQFP
jgi:AmiR/NasT family two-component response regulator